MVEQLVKENLTVLYTNTFIFLLFKVNLLRLLPTRYMSRLFGRLSKCYVPVLLRKPLFGLYTTFYKCKMNEAAVSDLSSYTTMTEFFTRKLKPGCRTVDSESCLVSFFLFSSFFYCNVVLGPSLFGPPFILFWVFLFI